MQRTLSTGEITLSSSLFRPEKSWFASIVNRNSCWRSSYGRDRLFVVSKPFACCCFPPTISDPLWSFFFSNIESICFGTMQPSFFQSRPFIPFSSLLFFLPCVNRMDGGDPVILHPGSYSPIYAILFLSVRVILLAVTSRQWYTLFFDERAAIGTNRSMAKMLCFWTRVVECLPSSCKKASSGRVDCCCRR